MFDKMINIFANKLLVEHNITYRELMSLGIDRGMRGEPTQMIESVVQVHPEGHLNIRFDRDSWNEQTNSKVTKRHFRMEDGLSFVRSMALKRSRKQTLLSRRAQRNAAWRTDFRISSSGSDAVSALDCPIRAGVTSPKQKENSSNYPCN